LALNQSLFWDYQFLGVSRLFWKKFELKFEWQSEGEVLLLHLHLQVHLNPFHRIDRMTQSVIRHSILQTWRNFFSTFHFILEKWQMHFWMTKFKWTDLISKSYNLRTSCSCKSNLIRIITALTSFNMFFLETKSCVVRTKVGSFFLKMAFNRNHLICRRYFRSVVPYHESARISSCTRNFNSLRLTVKDFKWKSPSTHLWYARLLFL